MKVVVNNCYGGFELSEEALKYMNIPYKKDGRWVFPEDSNYLGSYECRTNPRLVEFIEEFGSDRASGDCSKLGIEEVPQGCLFRIDNRDGLESIDIQYTEDYWYAAT